MHTTTYFVILITIVSMPIGCDRSQSRPQRVERTPERPLADESVVIAAVGDSLTWGAMAFGMRAPSGGYPALLEAKLQAAGYDMTVLNKGISGEHAYETAERFRSALEGADLVLIMIGTNDVIRPESCPEPHHCRTIDHISALLDEALRIRVVPLISTIPPAQPRCNRSWANAPIQELNDQIMAVAHARNVKIVDNHQAILDHGEGRLFADCLHFTDEGYDVIAQQWYEALMESGMIKP